MPINRAKPWNQFPRDHNLGDQAANCLDYILTQLNQLVTAGSAPPGTKLQTMGGNIIDPTTNQINSAGSRVSSITTSISFTTTTTSVTFFWDGTNGSKPFQVFRDDGTTFGPSIAGSAYTVTGLVASTTYYFYPYFDEATLTIKFVAIGGTSIGTPSIAFTAPSYVAAQQQILRGRIPLAFQLASPGVTLPASGTGSGTGGSGGGGAGGGYNLP